MSATTPDNYTVNESGAWTVDGVVQTKNVETLKLVLNNGMTRYIMEGMYYSPEANPYIDDSLQQEIRSELFAILQEKLDYGHLSGNTTYLVCRTKSFSTKEDEKRMLDMTNQVCYEIADYVNENTDVKVKDAIVTRFLAGGDLSGSSHNPGIEITFQ